MILCISFKVKCRPRVQESGIERDCGTVLSHMKWTRMKVALQASLKYLYSNFIGYACSGSGKVAFMGFEVSNSFHMTLEIMSSPLARPNPGMRK